MPNAPKGRHPHPQGGLSPSEPPGTREGGGQHHHDSQVGGNSHGSHVPHTRCLKCSNLRYEGLLQKWCNNFPLNGFYGSPEKFWSDPGGQEGGGWGSGSREGSGVWSWGRGLLDPQGWEVNHKTGVGLPVGAQRLAAQKLDPMPHRIQRLGFLTAPVTEMVDQLAI